MPSGNSQAVNNACTVSHVLLNVPFPNVDCTLCTVVLFSCDFSNANLASDDDDREFFRLTRVLSTFDHSAFNLGDLRCFSSSKLHELRPRNRH